MLPWMRYESQGTMHMDGAVRMLEHFNIRRRQKYFQYAKGVG